MLLSCSTAELSCLVKAIFVCVIVMITICYGKNKNAIFLLANARGYLCWRRRLLPFPLGGLCEGQSGRGLAWPQLLRQLSRCPYA